MHCIYSAYCVLYLHVHPYHLLMIDIPTTSYSHWPQAIFTMFHMSQVWRSNSRHLKKLGKCLQSPHPALLWEYLLANPTSATTSNKQESGIAWLSSRTCSKTSRTTVHCAIDVSTILPFLLLWLTSLITASSCIRSYRMIHCPLSSCPCLCYHC